MQAIAEKLTSAPRKLAHSSSRHPTDGANQVAVTGASRCPIDHGITQLQRSVGHATTPPLLQPFPFPEEMVSLRRLRPPFFTATKKLSAGGAAFLGTKTCGEQSDPCGTARNHSAFRLGRQISMTDVRGFVAPRPAKWHISTWEAGFRWQDFSRPKPAWPLRHPTARNEPYRTLPTSDNLHHVRSGLVSRQASIGLQILVPDTPPGTRSTQCAAKRFRRPDRRAKTQARSTHVEKRRPI
jgi:hypothetical protein